eukprot:359897-Alexandrium_andersonii.AAC.1
MAAMVQYTGEASTNHPVQGPNAELGATRAAAKNGGERRQCCVYCDARLLEAFCLVVVVHATLYVEMASNAVNLLHSEPRMSTRSQSVSGNAKRYHARSGAFTQLWDAPRTA